MMCEKTEMRKEALRMSSLLEKKSDPWKDCCNYQNLMHSFIIA